jgi:hypothetical protein
MDWLSALGGMLQRYSGQGGGAAAAPEDPHGDFEQVSAAAPREVVRDGLSHAFRSDQTPPFPEMAADLFRHSDPNQRAGLLNRLLGSAGPGLLAAVPGLAGLLGGGQVGVQQAQQVSPEQVKEMAAHAEKQNPSIIDQVSGFYAQHPQVIKALGGMALTLALQHMLRRRA